MGQAIAAALLQQLLSKVIDEIGPDDEKEKEKRTPIRDPGPPQFDVPALTKASQGAPPPDLASTEIFGGPPQLTPPALPVLNDIPISGTKMDKVNAFLKSPLGDLATGTLGAIPNAIMRQRDAKERKEERKQREEEEKRRQRIRQGQGNVQSSLAIAAALNALIRPGGAGGGF